MKLPAADRVQLDPRKLRDYALSQVHPVGRHKARYLSKLGFHTERWQDLEQELRRIAADGEAEIAEATTHGQKYIVRGTLKGPAGEARVVTVWIVLAGEESPRFVTVYPET